jgi:hypothetical protein
MSTSQNRQKRNTFTEINKIGFRQQISDTVWAFIYLHLLILCKNIDTKSFLSKRN